MDFEHIDQEKLELRRNSAQALKDAMYNLELGDGGIVSQRPRQSIYRIINSMNAKEYPTEDITKAMEWKSETSKDGNGILIWRVK